MADVTLGEFGQRALAWMLAGAAASVGLWGAQDLQFASEAAAPPSGVGAAPASSRIEAAGPVAGLADTTAPARSAEPTTPPVPTSVEAPVTAPPPPPAPPTTPAPAVAVAPAPGPERPGRVFVGGDSVTFTTFYGQGLGEGAPDPDDIEIVSGMGWTAANVQDHLDAALAAGPVDTLVVALGTNDGSPELDGEGWTDADVDAFRTLFGSVGDDACLVVVLPGHGPQTARAHAAELDEARSDIAALADERRQGEWYGPTVVVDWQVVVDAWPDLVAADGIHLRSTTPLGTPGLADHRAAAHRASTLWDGVAACADA